MPPSETTPWHRGPMCALDTETTGVDVSSDRIVTATTVAIRPGEAPDARSHLIAVDVDIPVEATAVHGITTERARANGLPAAQVLDAIAHDLVEALESGVPVVGMNVAFDLTILDRELRRNNLPTVEARLGGLIRPVVDAMVLDKAVDPYRRGKRQLTSLCEHYGVRIDGAHDATADALAAARVAWAIANRHPHIGGADLLSLHASQVGWRREQNDSFRRYLMRELEEQKVRASRITDEAELELLRTDMAALARRIDAMDGSWPMHPFGGAR